MTGLWYVTHLLFAFRFLHTPIKVEKAERDVQEPSRQASNYTAEPFDIEEHVAGLQLPNAPQLEFAPCHRPQPSRPVHCSSRSGC